MHIYMYTKWTQKSIFKARNNTVSQGIFLQIIESIERSRKNINEKELQENGITYMVFSFSFTLYCEQIYTLFEKLPD